MLINILICWAFIAVIILFGYFAWELLLKMKPELREYIESDDEL